MSGRQVLRRANGLIVAAAFSAPWIVLPLMPLVAITWSFWAMQ